MKEMGREKSAEGTEEEMGGTTFPHFICYNLSTEL